MDCVTVILLAVDSFCQNRNLQAQLTGAMSTEKTTVAKALMHSVLSVKTEITETPGPVKRLATVRQVDLLGAGVMAIRVDREETLFSQGPLTAPCRPTRFRREQNLLK